MIIMVGICLSRSRQGFFYVNSQANVKVKLTPFTLRTGSTKTSLKKRKELALINLKSTAYEAYK